MKLIFTYPDIVSYIVLPVTRALLILTVNKFRVIPSLSEFRVMHPLLNTCSV